MQPRNDLSSATCVVTGGLGFIGSNLAHELVARGAAVRIVDALVDEHGGNPRNVEGLDVEIVEGGTDIVPQSVLADGSVDYAIAWVPKALASREQGAGITDVAQIFQRSGTLQVSFADKGITSAADLEGRTVGN
ncbi:MAG TPA: ABC transporter substrate-binding protein, partial [Ilumatobacteraceae bacterium]